MLRLAVLLVAIFAHQSFADEPEAIVGGQPAAPGEFPYQCSLNYGNRHICGCSILGSRHVLTAAHCLKGIVPPPYTSVRILTGSVNAYKGKAHSVKSAVIHPSYNPSQLWINDIAVITLSTPIQLDRNSSPVTLANSPPADGSQCVLSGWGLTSTNGQPSNQLLKMRTSIYSRGSCANAHRVNIYQGQVCALTGRGIGACQGDSGGPLVCNGQQVGITSWVVPCAKGYPDVYTDVYHYRSFISQAMARM